MFSFVSSFQRSALVSVSKVLAAIPKLAPTYLKGHDTSHLEDDTDDLQTLITSLQTFFSAFDDVPPAVPPTEALLNAMKAEADLTGVDYSKDPHSKKMFYVAYNCIGLTSPDHPLEVQVYIAIYTWLSFLIDDKTATMLSDVQQFQQRLYAGEPQPTPLLTAYAKCLRDTYKYYDPVIAGFIIISSLSFVNTCLLETRQEYQNMPAYKGGEKWPYYFREKEGICDAYALFNFPQSMCPDISQFLQAIPDIGVFINLGNDVMSFYKEEIAGETNNYIHKRARYEGKSAGQVLKDISEDTIEAFQRASLVLAGKGPYKRAFMNYVTGYLAMHRSQPRWKLAEIGF